LLVGVADGGAVGMRPRQRRRPAQVLACLCASSSRSVARPAARLPPRPPFRSSSVFYPPPSQGGGVRLVSPGSVRPRPPPSVSYGVRLCGRRQSSPHSLRRSPAAPGGFPTGSGFGRSCRRPAAPPRPPRLSASWSPCHCALWRTSATPLCGECAPSLRSSLPCLAFRRHWLRISLAASVLPQSFTPCAFAHACHCRRSADPLCLSCCLAPSPPRRGALFGRAGGLVARKKRGGSGGRYSLLRPAGVSLGGGLRPCSAAQTACLVLSVPLVSVGLVVLVPFHLCPISAPLHPPPRRRSGRRSCSLRFEAQASQNLSRSAPLTRAHPNCAAVGDAD